jgi:hypothetical protein
LDYNTDVGVIDALGNTRSLINNTDGNSLLPFVEKGSLGPGSGGMFFLMDVNMLDNANFSVVKGFDPLVRNLFEYAVATVPEPSSLTLFGVGILGLIGWIKLYRRAATVSAGTKPSGVNCDH